MSTLIAAQNSLDDQMISVSKASVDGS